MLPSIWPKKYSNLPLQGPKNVLNSINFRASCGDDKCSYKYVIIGTFCFHNILWWSLYCKNIFFPGFGISETFTPAFILPWYCSPILWPINDHCFLLSLCDYLLQFLNNQNFHIHRVQITRKCIFQSNTY